MFPFHIVQYIVKSTLHKMLHRRLFGLSQWALPIHNGMYIYVPIHVSCADLPASMCCIVLVMQLGFGIAAMSNCQWVSGIIQQ